MTELHDVQPKKPDITLDDGLLHYYVQPLSFSATTAIGAIRQLAQHLAYELTNQRVDEPAEDLDGQIHAIGGIRMLADMLDQFEVNAEEGRLSRKGGAS